LSFKTFDPELTAVPKALYTTQRLVFSHYYMDKKIVRIGKNAKQKNRRFTFNNRCARKFGNTWNRFNVSRKRSNYGEFTTDSSKNTPSKHMFN